LERLIVPTICIYEVFKRLLVERDEDSALLAVGLMSHGREVELDRNIAIEAAQISRERKLPWQTASFLPPRRLRTQPCGRRMNTSKAWKA
jgi:toxin FitB